MKMRLTPDKDAFLVKQMELYNEYELISHSKLADCTMFIVDMVYRPMHLHKELELCVVLSGSCRVSTDRQSFEAGPGEILLFDAGSSHELCASGAPARLLTLQISNSFCARFYPQIRSIRFGCRGLSSCLGPEQLPALRRAMLLALSNYLRDTPEAPFACMAQINAIFAILLGGTPYRVLSDTENMTQTRNAERMHRILHYLETHYSEPVRLSEIAEREGLTQTYLSHLFREQLPRVYSICQEINRRLMEKLHCVYPNDPGKWEYMAADTNSEVRMANLCLACCHKINGVSQLHTDILEKTIFRDYYNLDHSRFLNITNGIAYRRWLCQSNPALTGYLQSLIGDGFLNDANALEALLQYRDDPDVLENLQAIKRKNKVRLAAYIAEHNGVNVDPDSIFDVQVKRLHEYKRQLLNVLHILTLYNDIKDHPEKPVYPQTFIFAAKASAGYYLAKQIISLIVAVSNLVNSDPQVQNKLKVVFIEDYKVSLAEIIIPAADLSEQISVAGKEASGTSNMKLMINGAVTLGTLDGANVEIRERVGDENMFLFGMTADEVQALWQRGYDPRQFLTPELDRVLQMLTSGVLGQRFDDVAASLLTPRFGAADSYMTVADFASYKAAKAHAVEVYQDRTRFTKMSLTNIARAGIFSSDRSVEQYAREIWDL